MIVVIDYGMGNVRSVTKALEFLGHEAIISCDPHDLRKADRLILPGVGAFGNAMAEIRRRGLVETMEKEVLENRKPFLGICLGMQLLAEKSYELGEHTGLGWIKGEVKKLPAEHLGLKVPHVGWNDVLAKKDSVLFKGVKENSSFYFVHSFAVVPEDATVTSGTAMYGAPFCAALEKGNIFATQFHPEKSQKDGLKVLTNFVEWKG